MSVTLEQAIRAVSPRADPAFVAASVAADAVAIMRLYGFTGAAEQEQLLGHMAVESAMFARFDENLSYRAETLTRTWPKRYPPSRAQEFAHSPQKLAIDVYGSRGGNRPGTTDGWDYRGSGGLQHTFRPEFDRVQKRTGVPVLSNPDLLRDKRSASLIWHAACSYCADRGALPLMKSGDTTGSTRKINGGLNGLEDRKTCVSRARKVLAGSPLVSSGVVLPPAPQQTAPATPAPQLPTSSTARVDVPDPSEARTTAEVEGDEKRKRDRAVVGTAAGTPGSGGAVASAQEKTDWVLIGGIVLGVALLGFVAIRYFWRRHAAAQEAAHAQQILQIAQRVEA